jgi:hypothetical protein
MVNDSFNIGERYDVVTIAPTVLKERYDNVKVVGKVGMEAAMQYMDVLTLHSNVKISTSGSVTLDDTPHNYTYVLFKKDSSNLIIPLALEYMSSVNKVSKKTMTIVIDDIDDNDAVLISNTLDALGYTNKFTKTITNLSTN